MPQTNAAKKALRVANRRRVINDKWRRKVQDTVRQLREVVTTGKKKEAQELLVKTQQALDRAARHNIIHPNRAARQKSRWQNAINNLTA